ncbi:MAG: hypothetical protein JOZ99_03080 [Actinobacteria bacterium]|nr:hypothetical protein [Actinomycetota bacterium]
MQRIDERRHDPDVAPAARGQGAWQESWYFDFATGDAVGGSVYLLLRPAEHRAWYWASLVQPGHGPVVVHEHDIALPRNASLEVRGEGLWAECVCETPLEHWSLGLEAFGVRLDDPLDAFRGELGERLPVGHDLSWEATVEAVEPAPARCGGRGYLQAGRVEGEVLLGRERIAIDGTGHRVHSWGPFDWRDTTWRWSGVSTTDGGALSVTAFDGGQVCGARWSSAGSNATRLTVEDLDFDVDVLGAAPLALATADGPPSRLWRALCRFNGPRATGVGWTAHVIPTTEDG